MSEKVNKYNLLKHKFSYLRKEHQIEISCSGIYAIVNIVNGHCYVGQSKDIKKRWISHKKDLRGNKHCNPYLQNAWNFYKENSFKFTILEKCETYMLNDQEQYWIERLEAEYNIARNVFKFSKHKASKNNTPDGYFKPGETFERPKWHLWVYGGHRHNQENENRP